MKSVPKLIRRFAGIWVLSCVLLLVVNLVGFAALMVWQSPDTADSPYHIAAETGTALVKSESGDYKLTEELSMKLAQQDAWAIFIENDTLGVTWCTENTPATILTAYTLSEIADLATGYLDGYPTYVGESENGIVVLGFPKDSYWKHTRTTWNYSFITNLPQTTLLMLLAICAKMI